MDTLCFSQYAVRYQRDDTVCYMNSLHLRPVYVSRQVSSPLDELFAQGTHEPFAATAIAPAGSDLAELLAELRNAFVVVKSPEVDKKALATILAETLPPMPRTVFILLTEACNFACTYCFINKGIAEAHRTPVGNMTVETATRAIDFSARSFLGTRRPLKKSPSPSMVASLS